VSECKKCGRSDGHYMGCAGISASPTEEHDLRYGGHASEDRWAFGECVNPKRPKGKGRAPLYCEEHSDPKNRK